MQPKPKALQPVGLSLGDIYYVLFRRKWLIIGFALVGIIAAIAYVYTEPPIYQSEAKLFIKYVQESKALAPPENDMKYASYSSRSDSILNTEMEILGSRDLADEVARNVGPEKVLAKVGGGKDPILAAAVIRNGLYLENPRKSSVIRVIFQHRDPTIVQSALAEIIKVYFQKHIDTHRPVGLFDDFLRQETDRLKILVSKSEEELKKAKMQAGIISVDDIKKSYTEEMSKLRQELFQAEADLVERRASLAGWTNSVASGSDTNGTDSPPSSEIMERKANEYKTICARLDGLWKSLQSYQRLYTEENSLVMEVREQISDTELRKKRYEVENPELFSVGPHAGGTLVPNVQAEKIKLNALEAKIVALTNRLNQVREEANVMAEAETKILQLQRKKELAESDYRYYSSKLEQSIFDETLGAGKTSNISPIQSPTPPVVYAAPRHKIVGGLAVGGVVCGLALAFLLEFVLDRTVKRPADIERRLNIPLLLSVPNQRRNGTTRRLKKLRKKLLVERNSSNGNVAESAERDASVAHGPEIAPWDDRHSLHRFYEGLRDRLVTFFEVRQLTHKPKLIGIAGCAKEAGVSTMAAGLAACLSETGDGNVLLVDMNAENGATTHFHQGKPACDLAAFLENDSRDEAMVQDRLYAVKEGGNGDRLPRILPKKFTYLVPKLKASEYDYIIFDMPMVSQISVTPRLAGYMDMMLMVVEAEKTDREAVERACNMLTEAKANVAVVLNKVHNYVPRRLLQEMPGDS